MDCIVSLTTWKGRINNPDLPRVLFSIFSQETKYSYEVNLTLSLEEFPNKEKDIPEILNDFVDAGKMKITWTEGNTRALKKLYPLYIGSKVPILTTDDDIILRNDAVETFMNVHQEHPDCILTELGHRLVNPNEICTGTFRLFPPNSLFELPIDYFMKYFKGYEDDVYLAILASLNNTKTIILKRNIATEINNTNYNATKLRDIYTKIPWVICRRNLLLALESEGIIKLKK